MSYFKSGSSLSEDQKKYCKCTLHVGARNSVDCNLNKSFKLGSNCYNPYAVCSKSTHRTGSVICGTEYDFESMPKAERDAFAALHGIDPRKYKTERALINALNRKSEALTISKRSPKKEKSSTKKAPVKKRSPKKESTKKASSKKAPVKKTSSKKASTKKAPVKKASTKKSAAKKTSTKKAPVSKRSIKKVY